jgi:Ser/Thr protein kinase RdoA (MazF antagonist)
MSFAGLPIIYSTLDPMGLVQQVLPAYELPYVKDCKFWHRGMSDVYLVETEEGNYILRISHYHWRTRSEVQFELEFLQFLANKDIPVAAPIPTTEGDLLITLHQPEGDRYASLFPYAIGEVPMGDLNIDQSRSLGELVAQIHQVSRSFTTKTKEKVLDLDNLIEPSLEDINRFLKIYPEDAAALHAIVDGLKTKLSDLPNEDPLWVVCWGDVHSGNTHFVETGDVTIFDFDQCGYSWRIFEVAKFWHTCLSTGLSYKIRRAFLEGYETINAFTPQEMDSLQAFTQLAHIWSWSININLREIYDYSRLDRSYFRQRLNQLKQLTSKDWDMF